MTLPEILQSEFKTELKCYEDGKCMPFLTSFERDGIMQGRLQSSRESIIIILETRFENVPEVLKNQINALNDLQLLKSLHKQSVTISSLEDFEKLLTQSQEDN